MEGYMEEEEEGTEGQSPRRTTRAGSATVAMAGLVAARSSGDADATSPVHSSAYGMAQMVSEEADDLLSSHMEFMHRRLGPRNGSGPQRVSSSSSFRQSSSSRRSSAQLADERAEAPIAFVAIVTFDLREGPCLVCVDPPIEDPEGQPLLPLTVSDVQALRTDMPFKALPENGLAAAELGSEGYGRSSSPVGGAASAMWGWATGWTKAGRSSPIGGRGRESAAGARGDGGKHHHDHCLFMMRVCGENLFGMSHFLRVEDPSSPRGYTQGAAVCLSRLPFFSLILQRLHSFSTDVIDRTACANQVKALAADLRDTRFEELGHSAVYQDLPVATALLELRSKLLAILRLLLLEGRVLLYAKSAATVSEAVMAVASLLPGSLPLGLGRLDPPGFGLKGYRWRKYGFPLRLFRNDAPLEPLMVIAGAADVLSKDGFLAGTTNSMVHVLPMANLDVMLDVDTWTVTNYRTDRARAAFDMGEQDRSFARELVRATKRHLGGGAVDDSTQAVGWQGSSAWLADQFQVYFEDLATTAAGCLARNARLEDERRRLEHEEDERRKAFEAGGRRGSAIELIAGVVSPTIEGIGLNKAWQQTATWLSGSAPVPVATALEPHGHRWAELWTETENFGVWQASHRLADSPPELSRSRQGSRPENLASTGTLTPRGAGEGRGGSSCGGPSLKDATMANGLLCSNGLVAGAFVDGGGVGIGGVSGAGTGSSAPRSGVHVFTYGSGDTYTGTWRKGKRHGVGVYEERATGNSYEGDWCDDLRHGRGVLTSGAKDFLYDGNWVEDKRTGQGNCVIRGRETYSGSWKDGEFHGKGVHCDARGDIYDGEFVHGQREGAGRWTSKAGLVYVGEWKGGRMSGVGQSTEADGTVYSGEWHDGRHAGEGTLTLPTGERYEGMFREGEKHGAGCLLTPEGDTLEGEWARSKPLEGDKEWRVRFANGDHYAGTVMAGVPHGTGTFKYANGDIFTGGWDRGLRNGHGICVFANGERFEGEWLRDHISYQGKGALTLADGTTHDFA